MCAPREQLLSAQGKQRPEPARALCLGAAESAPTVGTAGRVPPGRGGAGGRAERYRDRAQGRQSSLDGRVQVRLHWVLETWDQGSSRPQESWTEDAPSLPVGGRATPSRARRADSRAVSALAALSQASLVLGDHGGLQGAECSFGSSTPGLRSELKIEPELNAKE